MTCQRQRTSVNRFNAGRSEKQTRQVTAPLRKIAGGHVKHSQTEDSVEKPTYYTHAEWRVRPGREADFIEAWRALSATFASLSARPLWGTLLASESDPTLFYSFGPWASVADIEAMRADPAARTAIERVVAMCDRATPGTYKEVAHVDLSFQST